MNKDDTTCRYIPSTKVKGFYATVDKFDLSKQFSIINLPSRGMYYGGKNKSLLVKYLTGEEEHQSIIRSSKNKNTCETLYH